MSDYPLGYSAEEAQRLEDQAQHMLRLTAEVFVGAGLRPGMRVLDLGCGVGDVSLLAARIVGSEGAVLGVDRAGSSIEKARSRAAGHGNVSFEQSELATFSTEQSFDAIVGRFVLAYVPNRVEVLRRLTRCLSARGVIAFLELDMSQIAQVPPSELFTRARGWVLGGFAAGGAELDMGSKLHATFRGAGLPAPSMISVQPVMSGPECPGYEELTRTLRSLLPRVERSGAATAGEMGLDSLAARLLEDAQAHERVLFMSRIVAAWTVRE